MDTPSKDTATKVWRWNVGGFGYSSNGYEGPYTTAITMDGAIVADFITAGVLRGIEITNGNGTFHVAANGTVSASAIDITGGSINIETNSESYSVITLSHHSQQHNTDWKHLLSPLESVLYNTDTTCAVLAQAGAVFFYTGYDPTNRTGTLKAQISSSTGDATFHDVYSNAVNCNDIYLGSSSGGGGSLRGELDAIWAIIAPT